MLRVILMLALILAAGNLFASRALAGNGGDPLPCFGEPPTIHNTTPGATVRGAGGPDVTIARGGVGQTFYGYGGDDLICAGANDVVYGGGGDDQIRAENAILVDSGSGVDFFEFTNEAIGVGVWDGVSGHDSVDDRLNRGQTRNVP